MKRLYLFLLSSVIIGFTGFAQNKKQILEPSYAWKIIEPLGLHEEATIDTLPINYGQRSVPSMASLAWATTGNYGAQGIDMIWSGRPEVSDFFFRDAVELWIPSSKTMKFYNTRTPMTLLSYTTAGTRDYSQEHLSGTFSGNATKEIQIGALLDYIYSKGCYANQADKGLIWGFSGSYMGPRYELQAWFNQFNLLNKENGGITDPLYITDPALVQGGVTSVDTKIIPTRLNGAHTRNKGKEVMINNRYKVGYWHYEKDDNDSIVSKTYIPVTSFIYTLNYKGATHQFTNTATTDFFENTYLNPDETNDKTSYWSLSNTLGVSLLEGFHKYAKFGLAAYLTYEINKYTQTPDTIDRSMLTPFPEGFYVPEKFTENKARVGAQLTKQRGAILRYAATAELGVIGAAAGEILADGNIETRIPLPFDTVSVVGFAKFTNLTTPYLLRNYLSNHFLWKNDFGKERRFKFGGALAVPRTGTRVSVYAENIQNHVYFGENFLPQQYGGSVQIFSAALRQDLHVGILHWDNSVIYQTTSNDNILALPNLAVYSNLYLKFKIATLYVQLGADCDYYTRYYAPNYQPATESFANQHTTKIGNYPFINVYANLKLSKVRFYLLMSNIGQNWISREYFSMPNYPLNPRRFQIGLSIDFAN